MLTKTLVLLLLNGKDGELTGLHLATLLTLSSSVVLVFVSLPRLQPQLLASQTRQGLRTRVVPRIDRQSLGDRTIERTVVPFIRSRNIAFKIQRLKLNTRFYTFIDNVEINFYASPKLLEVIKNTVEDTRTNDTPFVVGETVVGQTSGCRLKLMDPNNGFDDGLSPYDSTELCILIIYHSIQH